MQLYSTSFPVGHDDLEMKNLIRKAKISADIRTVKWIREQAKKGLFHNVRKNYTDEFVIHIHHIINVLDSIYTPTFSNCAIWDFDLKKAEFRNDFDLDIVLHYSGINIKNSITKGSHFIKDLIIYLELRKDTFNDSWCIKNPTGIRASLSFKEWHIGYSHSHLPPARIRKSTNIFDISFQTYFNNSIVESCKTADFTSFLEELDSNIREESPEFTSYITIKDIEKALNDKSEEEINSAIDLRDKLLSFPAHILIRDKEIKFNIKSFKDEKVHKSNNI